MRTEIDVCHVCCDNEDLIQRALGIAVHGRVDLDKGVGRGGEIAARRGCLSKAPSAWLMHTYLDMTAILLISPSHTQTTLQIKIPHTLLRSSYGHLLHADQPDRTWTGKLTIHH